VRSNYYITGLLDICSINKALFAVDLKHPSFLPSADFKPASINLVLVMPWQCMLDISMCGLWSVWWWETIDI